MEGGVREETKHKQRRPPPRGVTGEGRMEYVFVWVVESKEKGVEGVSLARRLGARRRSRRGESE